MVSKGPCAEGTFAPAHLARPPPFALGSGSAGWPSTCRATSSEPGCVSSPTVWTWCSTGSVARYRCGRSARCAPADGSSSTVTTPPSRAGVRAGARGSSGTRQAQPWRCGACSRPAGGCSPTGSSGCATVANGFPSPGVGPRVWWVEGHRYPEWFREDFSALLELLPGDKIHPVVAERLPLPDSRRPTRCWGARGERKARPRATSRRTLADAHRPAPSTAAEGHLVASGGRDDCVAGVEGRYSQRRSRCGRLPRRAPTDSTGATRLRPWPAPPGRWWRPTLSTASGPAPSEQHGRHAETRSALNAQVCVSHGPHARTTGGRRASSGTKAARTLPAAGPTPRRGTRR
jgi:hypothetical protein